MSLVPVSGRLNGGDVSFMKLFKEIRVKMKTVIAFSVCPFSA
jgi:hypothetical protein